MTRFLISLFSLFFSSLIFASEFDELDQRNKHDINLDGGSEFETSVVRHFWGDAKFMRVCVPPDTPIPESFTIYVEILSDGSVGEFVFTRNNVVTKCIREEVENRLFPSFGQPFMAKINLSFKE